jgi:hypothetical protein
LDLAFDAIAIRMGLWTWRGIGLDQGWFGVPAGNFYAWLFVTFAFSLVTRWLRDAAAGHPVRAWLQLAVPIPAYAILLVGLVPFAVLKPRLDSAPGGGLGLFAITLAAFVAVAAWAVWGPSRTPPNGERQAILELGVAFTSRIAIHVFFLASLLVLGLVTRSPLLAVYSLLLLGAEFPLARLVRSRGATSATPEVAAAQAPPSLVGQS